MTKVNLYPHQKEAIRKMHNGCILCGAVGTGKSRTSLAYYHECVGKGDIYIITTAKKRDSEDWIKEAEPFKFDVKMTVDSWNNIKKYTDVRDAFFIFDEQRVVGSGAWVKAFYKITKENKWILLSATPGDTWSDYIPVFVANGFYKNKTEFNRLHAVFSRYTKYPKIEKYLGEKRLEKLRRSLLVPMIFKRHTVPHHIVLKTSYDKEKYRRVFRDRWDVYENKPIEQISKVCYLCRRVVNSDASRLSTVIDILEKHDRVILFYNFVFELELLRELLDSIDILYAEWNGQKHEEVPDGDKWVYLVQYTSGAEGWNCITSDTMIFYSQNYSWRMTEQACGRIDRLNTPYVDLYYYHLRSASSIDIAIARALKNKEDFNERNFIKE